MQLLHTQLRPPFVFGIIPVKNQVIDTVKRANCIVPYTMPVGVAFEKQCPAALHHRDTVPVNIWACQCFGTAYPHFVGAFCTAATIIIGGKEIEIIKLFENKWRLDGPATRCGIAAGPRARHAREGKPGLRLRNAAGVGIEFDQFNAIPK